jgi:hypothetical protein
VFCSNERNEELYSETWQCWFIGTRRGWSSFKRPEAVIHPVLHDSSFLREDAQGIAGSVEKNVLGDGDERQTGFDLLILALGRT